MLSLLYFSLCQQTSWNCLPAFPVFSLLTAHFRLDFINGHDITTPTCPRTNAHVNRSNASQRSGIKMGGGVGATYAPMPHLIYRQAAQASYQHMTDPKGKHVLKEAVDAVVNSFAKHTHGYGRGKFNFDFQNLWKLLLFQTYWPSNQ